MVSSTDAIVKAALEYAARGWRVVPLYGIKDSQCECAKRGDCPSPGKHPRINNWEKEASADDEVILTWFEKWPHSNVGVHMGEASNLIDFECDSAEAEQTFMRLCKGQPPVVPTYQSKRGKHRLFQWRSDLPNPNKVRFSIGQLDVLTGYGNRGQQSVFPPSIRPDAEYKWLIRPDEADPGIISDELAAQLSNLFGEDVPKEQKPKSDRMKLYQQDAVLESVDGRDNVIYAEACHQWRLYAASRGQRAFRDPDVQMHVFQTLWAWNHAKCRPPLSDDVIQQKVESARTFLERQLAAEQVDTGPQLTIHGLEFRDNEWWPGAWELTVLLGDPPYYFLKVPAWAELLGSEDKTIRMEVTEWRDAAAVAQAIFKATKTIVVDDRPGAWPALWNGTAGNKKDKTQPTRGLKAKLLDKAKLEEASADMKKRVMIAEMLMEKLGKAKASELPDSRGYPVKLPTGLIWLRWLKIWENEINLRQVTPADLQALSRAIGIKPADSKVHATKGSTRLRFVLLTQQHVDRLERLCELSGDAPPKLPE